MRWLNRIAVKVSLSIALLLASHASLAEAGLNVWTTNGPGGGSITAFAINPRTPTTLYAGTEEGGVFKSTDGGGTWAPANTGLPSSAYVTALTIDPQAPTTLYAGTLGSGIYKSIDGGGGWSAVNTGLTNPKILALAIDPLTPTILYAGAGCCAGGPVFKSTDGGANWSLLHGGSLLHGVSASSVYVIAIDPLTPSTLYAGTDQGLFKSTDGGES